MTAKVVPLKPVDSPEFLNCLRETLGRVVRARDGLLIDLVSLSTLGPLNAWMRSLPPGQGVEFDRELLTSTGDKRLDVLCQLLDHLHEAVDALSSYQPRFDVDPY